MDGCECGWWVLMDGCECGCEWMGVSVVCGVEECASIGFRILQCITRICV